MVKYWHHVVPAENLHRDAGFSNLIIAQITIFSDLIE